MSSVTEPQVAETEAPAEVILFDDITADVVNGTREPFDILRSDATPEAVRTIVDTQDKGVTQKTLAITGLVINAYANFYNEPSLGIEARKLGRLYGFAEFLINHTTAQDGSAIVAQDTIEYIVDTVQPRERDSPMSLLRALTARDLQYNAHYTRSLLVAMLSVRIWVIEHSTDKENMTSYYDKVRADRYADKEEEKDANKKTAQQTEA